MQSWVQGRKLQCWPFNITLALNSILCKFCITTFYKTWLKIIHKENKLSTQIPDGSCLRIWIWCCEPRGHKNQGKSTGSKSFLSVSEHQKYWRSCQVWYNNQHICNWRSYLALLGNVNLNGIWSSGIYHWLHIERVSKLFKEHKQKISLLQITIKIWWSRWDMNHLLKYIWNTSFDIKHTLQPNQTSLLGNWLIFKSNIHWKVYRIVDCTIANTQS